MAKLVYTFCLLCIDQNPTLDIGKSFQIQVHQSRHQEWKETKKSLNSWNTVFLSRISWPLGVVLPGSRRLLCKGPWARVHGWGSGWPVSATLMGCHPIVPSVMHMGGSGTRVSLHPRITGKSPLIGLVQSEGTISGQWVRVRISKVPRQAAARVQGEVLRWRKVGHLNKALPSAALTKVPQLDQRWSQAKTLEEGEEVAEPVGALRADRFLAFCA